MCLTIPAKVIDLRAEKVFIEDGPGLREVQAPLTPGLKPGDWILHINGLIIKKIPPEDAREILDLLQSGWNVDTTLLGPRFRRAVKAIHSGVVDREDIVYLLGCEDDEKEALFKEADTVRRAFLKDFICIHGIIEFSNHCTLDCLYCGLRAESSAVTRYRMTPDEIVAAATTAVEEKGYKLLVLQSGEDPWYTDQILADIIKRIKAAGRVFLFISAGQRGYESYRTLKKAGASGALLRFESSNRDLFGKLHPRGKGFDERFEHIRFLKELGYYVATGSLTGLPGQTLEDIAGDIITTRGLARMVSTGPFVPSPCTPLAGADLTPGGPELHLKVTAILRLVMKSARIPVVTAFETLAGVEGRRRALSCGANSLMINLTPERYRTLYTIYPDRFHDAEGVLVRNGLFKYEGSFRMLEERMAGEISGDGPRDG